MSKNKIKLSLIDDYIYIITTKNFVTSTLEHQKNSNLLKTTSKLEQIYNKLFDELKMCDDSLLILKKELCENNSLFLKAKSENFNNVDTITNNLNFKLDNILCSLKSKLQNLKLNFQYLI